SPCWGSKRPGGRRNFWRTRRFRIWTYSVKRRHIYAPLQGSWSRGGPEENKVTSKPATPLLDTITVPADLRQLEPGQLRQVADELRTETIDAVSVTGGHLGAGLGVVELTVALHYVFDTPA